METAIDHLATIPTSLWDGLKPDMRINYLKALEKHILGIDNPADLHPDRVHFDSVVLHLHAYGDDGHIIPITVFDWNVVGQRNFFPDDRHRIEYRIQDILNSVLDLDQKRRIKMYCEFCNGICKKGVPNGKAHAPAFEMVGPGPKRPSFLKRSLSYIFNRKALLYRRHKFRTMVELVDAQG